MPTINLSALGDSVVNEKLANAVIYLIDGCKPARPGITAILKLLYFSDYEHYQEHLKPITGADYVALPNGPVIDNYQGVFDALVAQEYIKREYTPVAAGIGPKVEFTPLRPADASLFSDTELKVLDDVITKYGQMTGSTLSAISHHRSGPWAMVWDAGRPGNPIPYIAFRWLDNMPDEDDLTAARKLHADPRLAHRVKALDQKAAAGWQLRQPTPVFA